jgi:hypothetical protein
VWFPDSADKTAQALEEFCLERLPLVIIANWRGFSGGQRDLFDGVLQAGSLIVEQLRTYRCGLCCGRVLWSCDVVMCCAVEQLRTYRCGLWSCAVLWSSCARTGAACAVVSLGLLSICAGRQLLVPPVLHVSFASEWRSSCAQAAQQAQSMLLVPGARCLGSLASSDSSLSSLTPH